ncbi:formylglycine-generating enzyme [Gammaproteobacteria bacterium]
MSTSRYTDWSPIGKGASAIVFKVFDQELKRPVAIKLLRHEYAENPDFMESLRQEVRISHDIYHRDICPIYEIYRGPCPSEMETTREVCIGIVMELIDGCELKKWIDNNKHRLRDTAAERFDLLRRVTTALITAHAHITHRDLKPANILLRQCNIGQPVIMDLGIALLGNTDNQIAGTPRYMAPEQYTNPNRVDARADLFALGVMAYEMFTDKTPPTSLCNVMRTGKPPHPRRDEIQQPSSYFSGLPRSLDEIIIQLMAYEPEDRPSSAAEVLKLLESVPQPPWEIARGGSDDLEWISVPGGKYMIGASPSDRLAHQNEKPRREVEISPFQITAYPITNQNYRNFLQSTGYRKPPFLDSPEFGPDDHPVVGVSWDDAREFARWVGGDLPSEAQWEYAARSGQRISQGSVYPWGSEPPTATLANINATCSRSTSPVNAYPGGRNAFGLHDLCGNVWEWCLDSWSDGYYSSLANCVRDPVNTERGEERSLRGGSYDSLPSQGRCTARYHTQRASQWPWVGFRVVKPVAA